ncbi:MAG: HAMP domain-containing histidine kinase [Planctomycetes bacterium]|nr:HAMP domain-containing histidine kinase [Planctomycetota bacterium]MBI3844856.1 HAMP domain-containing histidine kinase [Planctomycetota bacterium]
MMGAAAQSGDAESGGTMLDLNLPVNGAIRQVVLEVYPRNRGTKSGVVALVRDRQRSESDEIDLGLASRMRALAYVSGAVAHDLKTPLNAMVFNVELLRQAILKSPAPDGEIRASQARYLDTLQAEILRLDRSLNSMLGQYRLLTGQRDVDLRELVRDIGMLVGTQARHQKIEFTLRIPDGPIRVNGARELLQNAILNIAINALEAMPTAGKLTFDLEVGDGEAVLSIRDTGPGMPVEILDKIGETRFSTKERRVGTGLRVARSCVESVGGHLGVESNPGQGTCVRVSVPLVAKEESKTHAIRTGSRRRS